MRHNRQEPGKIICIAAVYSARTHGRMMAVDFLREEGGTAYRRLKYFYAEEWPEILAAGRYEAYQEHDSVNTVATERCVNAK